MKITDKKYLGYIVLVLAVLFVGYLGVKYPKPPADNIGAQGIGKTNVTWLIAKYRLTSKGTLIVDGTSTLTGAVTNPGGLTSTGTISAEQLTSTDDLDVTDAATIGGDASITGAVTIGDGTNQAVISSAGVVTLEGTAQRILTIRPEIDYVAQVAHAKPTQGTTGVFKWYSFPVYAADDEQLFFHANVPGRWNGSGDITFHLLCALGGAEDIGDYFKFRLSWESTHAGGVLPATSHAVDVEQIVLAGRAAANDEYELSFTIDWDADGAGNEILNHDLLGATLYRVDATNPDVTSEIRVLDWHLHYPVDKMFAAP